MEKQRWLDSDSFVKRAFAVYGYCLAAIGMIYLGLVVVVLVFAFIGAILGLL